MNPMQILKRGWGGRMTNRQLELIRTCKEAGYGWAKFAESVEASGSCSQKQEDTLCVMTQKIGHTKAIKAGRFNSSTHPGYSNISDNEAMRSGDCF